MPETAMPSEEILNNAMTNLFARRTRQTYRDSLRIGLFTESFQPVQNGVTTSVLTLIEGLREERHRVCVFAPEHQDRCEPETSVMRFPSFVTQFNPEYPLAYPFYPRLALASHFSKLRLNVVHTHTPFVLGLTGANLARRRNVPLVSTFHTLYSQYSHYVPVLSESVAAGLLEHYLPWYYNRVSEIICPSRVAEQHLRDLGVERPITIIPTGIPLPSPALVGETARQCARQSLGLDAHTPVMLYAGRLAKEKNIGMLIEVFAKVRSSVPDAHLIIAGGGPYCEELRALALAVPGGEAIHFVGLQSRCQLSGLYAAADVFCFPSPSETQGLVIGEARAAGVPCVVVDAGGAPETVRHGEDGFRVSCEEPEAFAACVIHLLTQPELRNTLRRNARRNARDFTPQRMVERVVAVYRNATLDAPSPDIPARKRLPVGMDWHSIGLSMRERHTTGEADERPR